MAVESFFLAVLLTITGGFLDAYTFCCRDQVFANAQTGNVVRVGIAIALGNPGDVIRYLIPIFAFAAGVLLALAVRDRTAAGQESLWRQRVLLLEIAVAAAVGIIPQGTLPNIGSNVLGILPMRSSGRELPQGGWQGLCLHHVYRKPAQRY